ncbi:hypothetical protein AAFF_G00317870 [Aldrovandia affinis]|uniref:Uncharacterized protein n=1 Tax=Aldrovandia affinis TaxID=143900 RepID=A0AAD7R7C8_9TELE|nr:hypothetical protein AAFF_G00317870 [Aldrovandia affinis]
MHQDAPPYLPLPLGEYRLAPTVCVHVCTEEEQFHLKSLTVTLDMARKIEVSTREQAADQEWHQLRRPRITSSRFREVQSCGFWSSMIIVAAKNRSSIHLFLCLFILWPLGSLPHTWSGYWQRVVIPRKQHRNSPFFQPPSPTLNDL